MEERLNSIMITDLPDGAIDSILSVLCSSTTDCRLFYLVYSLIPEPEESTPWKDVANFRLVCKSFQKVTDRVVPSFALYQQLFNKGVDPSQWITKQEEELTTKHKGFVSNPAWFQENRKSCNPLLLPELSSMPLFALESLINVKIHELLISNAALKSMIKIAYAFPNCNTVGFTLTLPNSSLHPGKQLAFQVTNYYGPNIPGDHVKLGIIIVQANDSSLATVLGLAPTKSNLVLNEFIIRYPSVESPSGVRFTNLDFFKNLSRVMPAYSAHEWIKYLLQVSNALPDSSDDQVMQDSMDIETEYNAEDELIVDEWKPCIFDCSLPMFSNQSSHSAQLQRMPLLPGSVVNQILYPSSTSLLQLLMMNKLIQFYRLNKCHKQLVLSNLLSNNSHPGYQSTVKQLFNHLTINQEYSWQTSCTSVTLSISQLSIHLGAVNEEFHGCHLVVKAEECSRPYISFKTRDSILEEKMKAYFGSGRLELRETTGILATLHLQKLLDISFIIPPVDIIAMFYDVMNLPLRYMEDEVQSYWDKKQYPKQSPAFDPTQVDPSCTLDDLKVQEENSVPFTSILINNSKEEYFYVVLQALQSNDDSQSFGHIRFGYKKGLFSMEEYEAKEYHFKTTNQFQSTDSSIELYKYWICRLTKPRPPQGKVVQDNERFNSINQSHLFNMLSVQKENALSYEIFYAESLKVQINNIKTLFQNDKVAAKDQIKHLESLLPNNIRVKCHHAKMIAQLDGCFEAIKFLNLLLQERPFNGRLWLTKAKILEEAKQFMEAARCYVLFCDFPTEEFISYRESTTHLKACKKAFQLFKQLKMWVKALRVWELSKQASNWVRCDLNLDLETEEKMKLMQAKKYIRSPDLNIYLLDTGLNMVMRLQQQNVETVMLYVEANYLKGDHEEMLKYLDKLLIKRPHVDIMIHKAAILHQLSRFDQAIECYQKAAKMTTTQIFNIEAAIDAAKRQQLVPWPFKVDFPPEVKLWTDEAIVMLFILHPNAVSSARDKVQVANNYQALAMQYLLNELDDAQAQMDKDKCCFAHLYPVHYMFKKLFNKIPLRVAEMSKDIIQDKLENENLPFLFQVHPKSKGNFQTANGNSKQQLITYTYKYCANCKTENSTLLWYPTHPCTIPFLLANGISPDEHGATFHANLSSCSHEDNYEDDYSVPFSTKGEYNYDKTYISMALLVEVDSVAAEQNTINEKPKGPSDNISWNKFPMTTIREKSHIGAICYLAITVSSQRWDNKICLVGNQSSEHHYG